MWNRIPPSVPWVVALLSITLNGALLLRFGRPSQARVEFTVGESLPSLMGANESGEAITIHFDKPTLVYVFRPGCGWCDKNYDNAKEIVLRASARFRVIAATAWPVNSSPERRTTLLTYLQKYPLAAEVVSIDPASLDQHFVQSFGTTPQLLIFNERGQITKTWAGALMGSRQSDAERFFGFSLPGIRQ